MTLTEALAPNTATSTPDDSIGEPEQWPPAIPETPGQVLWDYTADRIWKITVNLDDGEDNWIEVDFNTKGDVEAGENTGSSGRIDLEGAQSLAIVMQWLHERGTALRIR